MKFDSPLFDRIRVKPDEDRRLRDTLPAASGRAAPMRRPTGRPRADAGARVLALLPRSRARVQPFLQFLRWHERRRGRALSEGRDHRPSPDLEDRHGGRQANRQVGVETVLRLRGRRRSVRHVRRTRGGRARQADPREAERRVVRNAERKALHALGLETDAERTEIKARFKELVKRHHPDANGGDAAPRTSCARSSRRTIT